MGSTDGGAAMGSPQSNPTPGPSQNAAAAAAGPSSASASSAPTTPTTPSGKFIEQINYGEIEEGEVSTDYSSMRLQ